jgi:LacI family transcriptional regulator
MAADKLDLLRRVIIDERRGAPLHLQLRRALKAIIDDHFEDGELFWPEVVIAESLGISRGTVRQALGDLARDGLLRRHHAKGTFVIKEVAGPAELQTVGLFIADHTSDFLSTMLQRISEVCRAQNLRMQIYHTHGGDQTATAYRQVERGPESEGILLMVEPLTAAELYSAFTDRGYRTVCIQPDASAYHGPFVETNATEAVILGVDYLVGLGHRKIALMVNEPDLATSVIEKVDAFRQRMAEVEGAEPIVVSCGTQFGQSSYDAAYAAMESVWDTAPTAIFAVSDPGAWAALKWFAEHRIDIPAQVSVLGFEDATHNRYMFPSLSSIAHPTLQLAEEAVKLLLENRQDHVRVHPAIVVRDSTGPPRSDK